MGRVIAHLVQHTLYHVQGHEFKSQHYMEQQIIPRESPNLHGWRTGGMVTFLPLPQPPSLSSLKIKQ